MNLASEWIRNNANQFTGTACPPSMEGIVLTDAQAKALLDSTPNHFEKIREKVAQTEAEGWRILTFGETHMLWGLGWNHHPDIQTWNPWSIPAGDWGPHCGNSTHDVHRTKRPEGYFQEEYFLTLPAEEAAAAREHYRLAKIKSDAFRDWLAGRRAVDPDFLYDGKSPWEKEPDAYPVDDAGKL